MEKIIFYTDCHVTNKFTKARKDNYLSSIMNKLYQIDNFCKQEKVNLAICGGDLTHKPTEDFIIFNLLYEYYKNTYVKHQMMAGLTHDYYSTLSNIDKSIMGSLSKVGVFDIVGESNTWNIDGIKIYSAHMAICEKPFWGHHLLYENFNLDVDLVLTSHLHMPFGIKKVNNVTFIAPGSIARNEAAEFNYNRTPQFVYIVISNGKLDKIELIPLDVELDVFHDKYLIKETEQPRSLEQMEQMIDFSDVMDAEGIIRKVGSTFSPGSVEEALRFKQKVENE